MWYERRMILSMNKYHFYQKTTTKVVFHRRFILYTFTAYSLGLFF